VSSISTKDLGKTGIDLAKTCFAWFPTEKGVILPIFTFLGFFDGYQKKK
jgi:hypothetical protein